MKYSRFNEHKNLSELGNVVNSTKFISVVSCGAMTKLLTFMGVLLDWRHVGLDS